MTTAEIVKIKTKKTAYSVASFFKKRFSPRVFAQDQVRPDHLKTIFEAVRFSPSSYNRQPWFFYYAFQGSAGFAKLASLLNAGNQWAGQAPLLILACYLKKDQYGENSYAQYDLGQAVAALVYQAQILGYYTHQLAGFDKKKAEKLVKENYCPWVIIAMGKLGDYQLADQSLVAKDNHPYKRKEKIAEEW